MSTRWFGDDATTELQWIAHEARALATERVDENSERMTEFISRKRALLEYVEQERTSRRV
jgi:hypothetical protein